MITVWCTQRRHAIKRSLLNHKTVKMHHKSVRCAMRNITKTTTTKNKTRSFSHSPLQAIITSSTRHRLKRCIKWIRVGGQKRCIDFKIPWSCRSAMHSNDQLFGLRLAFLRGLFPLTAIQYEADAHYTEPPKRIHWFNPQLFNCGSSLSTH